MNGTESNPCFPFDESSGKPESVDPLNLTEASLEAVINRFQRGVSSDEFLSYTTFATKRVGLLPIVRSLALSYIDEKELWRYENCTSIYDFCGKQHDNVLAVSRGTVSEGISIAKTLKLIAGFKYREGIHKYLEEEGGKQNRGTISEDGQMRTFRLNDFVKHVSKLRILQQLIDKEKDEIDWQEFFSRDFLEYTDYVSKLIGPTLRGFSKPEKKDSPDFRPGRIPDESLEASQKDYASLTDLDPFSEREDQTQRASKEDRITEYIPLKSTMSPIKFNMCPTGTLSGHPIYNEWDLNKDKDYSARALAFFRKEALS